MQKIKCYFYILVVASLLVGGCSGTREKTRIKEMATAFDQTFQQYAKHLRWGHFRRVLSFMMKQHVADNMQKISTLDDIKITRVEPIVWLFEEDNTTMTGEIEVDYYMVSDSIVRSITQNQTWRYIDEVWRLDGGLPDFK